MGSGGMGDGDCDVDVAAVSKHCYKDGIVVVLWLAE